MIRVDVYFHNLKRKQFDEGFGLVVEYARFVYDKHVLSLHGDGDGNFCIEGRLLENSTRSMRLPSPFRRIIDKLVDKFWRTPRGQYTYGPSRRSQR